jgi:hypothetical protein
MQKNALFWINALYMVNAAPESQWILELFWHRVNWNFNVLQQQGIRYAWRKMVRHLRFYL